MRAKALIAAALLILSGCGDDSTSDTSDETDYSDYTYDQAAQDEEYDAALRTAASDCAESEGRWFVVYNGIGDVTTAACLPEGVDNVSIQQDP